MVEEFFVSGYPLVKRSEVKKIINDIIPSLNKEQMFVFNEIDNETPVMYISRKARDNGLKIGLWDCITIQNMIIDRIEANIRDIENEIKASRLRCR